MSLKPVLPGNVVNVPKGGGGGGGAPQLPFWTWLAGDSSTPGTGQFTTDSDDPNSTLTLKFSDSVTKILSDLMPGTILYLTDVNGVVASFTLSTSTPVDDEGSTSTLAVAQEGSTSVQWAGAYTLSFAPQYLPTAEGDLLKTSVIKGFATAVAGTDFVVPGGAGTVEPDSGWTAPQSVGNKNQLANYAGGGPLAGVDPTADAALVAIVAWAQALETALALGKIPNA